MPLLAEPAMREKSDTPDSSQRLQELLRGVTTSEMKAVRADVKGQLNSLPAGPAQPLRAGIVPPAPLVVEKLAAAEESESAAEESAAVEEPRKSREPTASDIEDLQRAGKIASDFLKGMDQITDVLML